MSAPERNETQCIELTKLDVSFSEGLKNMIGKACVLVILGSLGIAPCFAQAAVGGAKKNQNYIGGAVAPKNPVVPRQRGEVVKTGPSTQRLPKH
jgi:hypothetical protein